MCLSSFFSAISPSVVVFRFAFRRLDVSISLKWRNGVGERERWNRGMGRRRKVQRISNSNRRSVHGFCRGLRNFDLTVKRFGSFFSPSFCCTLPSSLFLYNFFSLPQLLFQPKNQCVRLRFILQLPLSRASAYVYSFLSCPAPFFFSPPFHSFFPPLSFMLWRTGDDWNYENCIIFCCRWEIETSDSFLSRILYLNTRDSEMKRAMNFHPSAPTFDLWMVFDDSKRD